MADEIRTFRESRLVDLFANYIIYRKENGFRRINETEVNMCFWNAIGGLDETYSSDEFIMTMRDDFAFFSNVLDKIANRRGREIRSVEGIRDKYSDVETYYTVPEIQSRWIISGTAVRKAITEKRLDAKERSGRKSKYIVLKEDFEKYAEANGIKLRDSSIGR